VLQACGGKSETGGNGMTDTKVTAEIGGEQYEVDDKDS
jgi:hypothetical protein